MLLYKSCFLEGGCLQVNPEQRMNVPDILERLAAIAETRNINFKEPLSLEGKNINSQNSPSKLFISSFPLAYYKKYNQFFCVHKYYVC